MSARFPRVAGVLAIGAVVGVVCYVLLPDSLDFAWHLGISGVVGWVTIFALAWRRKISGAELWWWPFRPPPTDRDDWRE